MCHHYKDDKIAYTPVCVHILLEELSNSDNGSNDDNPEITQSQFKNQKYICLETYKKNGQAVRTPVWFVESKGIFYVRTSAGTGKVKRIRNNADVQIMPCGFSGKPKGTQVKAKAYLSPPEEPLARNLLKHKYGLIYWLVGMFYRSKSLIIAIHPL